MVEQMVKFMSVNISFGIMGDNPTLTSDEEMHRSPLVFYLGIAAVVVLAYGHFYFIVEFESLIIGIPLWVWVQGIVLILMTVLAAIATRPIMPEEV